jgi:uncharacterized protein
VSAAEPAEIAGQPGGPELEQTLLARLRAIGPIAVAYSGGADSALVLAAAVRALGPERVLAVTALSESLAAAELAPAAEFAATLAVRHLTPRTHELSRPGYRANGRDRCYFCKSEVLEVITGVAAAHGFDRTATGTNADDAADPFRPGIQAGAERGVHTPLRDAGFTKRDVRLVSRRWGLPTWDKPATPCLASRIRYGIEVTPYRLARVDRAESALRALFHHTGLRISDLRVRDLGDAVRVEVDRAAVRAVGELPGLAEAVAAAGFGSRPVEVTPFRSGALNIEPAALPRRE